MKSLTPFLSLATMTDRLALKLTLAPAIALSMGLALLFTACQNQSRDNNNSNLTAQQLYNQSTLNGSQYTSTTCTNCPVNQSIYYSNVAVDYRPWDRSDVLSMAWTANLKGDGSQAFGQNDSRIAWNYRGVMTVEANAIIYQNDNFLCNAPTGNYTVRTTSAGTHSGGLISNLKFEMVGNSTSAGFTRIIGTISSGSIFSLAGYSSLPSDVNTRLTGSMIIETVNGKACQRTIQLQYN